MKKILVHGSGHKASSWNETISYMKDSGEVLCPNLFSILNGKEPTYDNLYASFAEYCNQIDGQIHLCGLSLGGILALQYALDFPDKVKTLVLIGTPHKMPKVMLAVQNIVFRFLPKSVFDNMEFSKKDIFTLEKSMKDLDFRGKVKNIACPTLIVCGKNDSANMKSALYFSENIPGAKLEILENTGHIVNEENPRALAKLLDEYCTD